MAVIVPILASAAGLTVIESAIVSVAFSVTGISKEINEAAADVFGEDLVQVANIAGMVYGATDGFSDFGSSAMSQLDPTELTTEAWDAAGAANTDALTEAVGQMRAEDLAGVTPPDANVFDRIGDQVADASVIDSGASIDQGGTNMLTGEGTGVDVKEVSANADGGGGSDGMGTGGDDLNGGGGVDPIEAVATAPVAADAEAAANIMDVATTPVAPVQSATTSVASAPDAAASKIPGMNRQSYTDKLLGIQRSTPGAAVSSASSGGSVFDKIWNRVGDKTIAGVIGGAGNAYTQSKANKLAREKYEYEKTRDQTYSGIRVTNTRG